MVDRVPTLPCIRCDKPLQPAIAGAENQPIGGTEFFSYGHYGSAYDPMDGTAVVINLCNECLMQRASESAVLERRQQHVEIKHNYNYLTG